MQSRTFCFFVCCLKKVKIGIYEYKAVSLPMVLCGCEILSLKLKDECRLFESMVLRRLFRPKMVKVTGGRRKLHNEEIHNLY
jgi:hypothetical protein